MTFKDHLITRYGSSIRQAMNRLKHQSLQISSAKNRTLFLERCRHHRILPKFLNITCPIKSPHASRRTGKFKFDILRETLKLTRAQHTIEKKNQLLLRRTSK